MHAGQRQPTRDYPVGEISRLRWVIMPDPFLENGPNPAWVRCGWSGYSDPSGDRNHLCVSVTMGHGELAYE
jgi:hypothetical protein